MDVMEETKGRQGNQSHPRAPSAGNCEGGVRAETAGLQRAGQRALVSSGDTDAELEKMGIRGGGKHKSHRDQGEQL